VIDGLVVGGLIQQTLKLSGIGKFKLGDPALTLRAGVDDLSFILQSGVAADDLASHGGEDVRSRLDGLNSTDGLAGADLKVGLGDLNEDNISQGAGGVLGDTDLGCRGSVSLLLFTCIQFELSVWINEIDSMSSN